MEDPQKPENAEQEHPSQEMLEVYFDPIEHASLDIAVKTHLETCEDCRIRAKQIQDKLWSEAREGSRGFR